MTPPYLLGKAAALEKLGMGERQMARVLSALRRQGKDAPTTYQALQQTFDPLITPNSETRAYTQKYIRTLLQQNPQARPAILNKYREWIRANLDQHLTPSPKNIFLSGRHDPEQSLVRLTSPWKLDPTTAHLRTGVNPSRIAWRGSVPQKYPGDTSVWFTGIPDIGAPYTAKSQGRLRAYDITRVPKELQGPWTPHIAGDPLETPSIIRRSSSKLAPISDSPFYEKVIKAKADPPLVADYKRIDAHEPLFMHTRGENLLKAGSLEKLENPEKYIGRVARVEAQSVYRDKTSPKKPGALRAPVFKDWHLEKNMGKIE